MDLGEGRGVSDVVLPLDDSHPFAACLDNRFSREIAAGGGVLTVDLQLFRNGSMNAAQVELLREAWQGLD